MQAKLQCRPSPYHGLLDPMDSAHNADPELLRTDTVLIITAVRPAPKRLPNIGSSEQLHPWIQSTVRTGLEIKQD